LLEYKRKNVLKAPIFVYSSAAILTAIAFPGIPLTVSGAKSALVTTRCPRGRLEKPLPSFEWKFTTPPGSNARLTNTNTTVSDLYSGPRAVSMSSGLSPVLMYVRTAAHGAHLD
jgi:hypothetical protein